MKIWIDVTNSPHVLFFSLIGIGQYQRRYMKNTNVLPFIPHPYLMAGVGALYKRQGATITPLIHGGGQESNLRASTENVSGIGGFGMAAQLAADYLEENIDHINNLEAYFLSLLNEEEINFEVNGKDRVPGVLNLTFPDMDGQSLVLQMDLAGIGISFGAACASGTMKASKMLLDLGLTEEDALSTVRISFGKIHNRDEVHKVAETLADILKKSISILEEHEG